MEILTILTDKMNKYLIQIINEYAIIDHNKLIQQDLKERIKFTKVLNNDLSIEDIIVKCFHLG